MSSSTSSSRAIAILVRISPNITTACLLSISSTLPIDVNPFMRTVSFTPIGRFIFLFSVAAFKLSAAFCLRSSFFCKCRSCRSFLFFIFSMRACNSSSVINPPSRIVCLLFNFCVFALFFVFKYVVASSSIACLYIASSCLMRFVASFSACCCLISLIVFSIRLLPSLIISSASAFAFLIISFRLCRNSSISFSYLAMVRSNSFSWLCTVCRFVSQ